MCEVNVTRLALHTMMLECSKAKDKKNCVLHFLKGTLHVTGQHGDEEAEMKFEEHIRTNFFVPYFKFWKECSRNNAMFVKKHNVWLSQEFHCTSILPCKLIASSRKGRPWKEFDSSCEASKRKKIEDLRNSISHSEMTYATTMNLRAEGDNASAELLYECTRTTPTRSKRILRNWKNSESESTTMSPEEALSLIISLNLTKNAYCTLRSSAISHGHNLYPSYYQVMHCKEQYYPKGISSTESMCEVPLQELLNQTCENIIQTIPEEATSINNLTLYCKWGFDGSSGYSAYKQKFEDKQLEDTSVFITSLVPLRLVESGKDRILWKNPRPSSTRFCRPIRIQWTHETDELSRNEEEYIGKHINELNVFNSKLGIVNFSLHLTMVDGKVCNALAAASGMRCYICRATISQLNNIKAMREKIENTEMYRFGLSVLHAYIRFFEWFLHISYRLDLKTWKVSKDKKDIMERRKIVIQDRFRIRMGLIVDMPKPGCGTSNDGNTARRFFANPSLSAEITGIDEDLIKKCGIILKVINSSYEIQTQNFEKYCSEICERYISLYNWYYMPVSVHKILIHGANIIKDLILPIGELSEEAQEAKNKDVRRFREHHTRKISHLRTNDDLFRRLLLSSDPHLSSFSHKTSRNNNKIDSDILELIVLPVTEPETDESTDEAQIMC